MKTCPQCNTAFGRRMGEPAGRYNKRVYCQKACSSAATSLARTAQIHADAFQNYIANERGCWEWQGSRFASEYGRIGIAYGCKRAHHLFYERYKGPIPEGAIVRHACDNPGCVNPDHLSLGSHADNKSDCVSRGRHAHGASSGTARLTEAQAISIMRSDQPLVDLASKFGVTPQTIGHIRRGKTWKHISRGAA